MADKNMQESIQIQGHFGPIRAVNSPLTLEISPLTVFIGPQGTGKSLVSQLLYFFRDAQYLISNYSKQETPEISVKKVIEGIRSGELSERTFASFVMTKEGVEIQYSKQDAIKQNCDRIITLYENNRIRPIQEFRKEIQEWLEKVTSDPSVLGGITSNALFIPAERSFFSRLINSDPASLGGRELPITMREFTKALFKAANTHQKWQEQSQDKPLEVNEIDGMITHELGGYAVFSKGLYARKWQWMPDQSDRPIEIEMASSGQMETWPMVSISQAMFGWETSQRPLFIHIEEPETHLHPSAQIAIAQLLAYLRNKGFRLVITTHSIFILYVLNNLILAAQNLPQEKFKNLPDPSQRLTSNQLSAYLFSDGTAISIRDDKSGELDESKLSSVLGDLEVQYNQIQAYDILWE
ncbi:AAA family ATPase [Spirulina sp. 06S082]|uniref:AAA family ATPase n=1 Tax=Spirulina sp. 06S082 TaxID=3110248 RepID=UPI002B1FE759|nr:AAA family ATPase [Spirulina sp. 06S082]MEA5470922.1 AAA family ATPase [Spirulina sp. 06S082]